MTFSNIGNIGKFKKFESISIESSLSQVKKINKTRTHTKKKEEKFVIELDDGLSLIRFYSKFLTNDDVDGVLHVCARVHLIKCF